MPHARTRFAKYLLGNVREINKEKHNTIAIGTVPKTNSHSIALKSTPLPSRTRFAKFLFGNMRLFIMGGERVEWQQSFEALLVGCWPRRDCHDRGKGHRLWETKVKQQLK